MGGGKGDCPHACNGHAGNLNASKLGRKQREEQLDVLSGPPSESDLPYGFWGVPDLVDRVCDRFRVEYDSRTSYHFLLHVAGLSFHRPEGVDRRRATQEQVDARMR